MRNLEMSQKQCTQLMSSNLSQENIKLKMQLDDAKADRDRFSEKLGLIAVSCAVLRLYDLFITITIYQRAMEVSICITRNLVES